MNCAPFIFTKLIKPVLSFLRVKGLLSVLYLDNFLLLGKSFDECKNNVTIIVNFLKDLGFVINYQKSVLTFSQRCRYLGFNHNSVFGCIPEDKKPQLLKCVQFLLRTKQCKIRIFAQIVGKLISICPAVCYGWVHTKLLGRE